MKCYHHNDLDGRCSAAIVNRFAVLKDSEDSEYIEVEYSSNIDITKIKDNETIFIVDFSFKPEIMKEVLLKTKDIVWIDHHKTTADYDYGIELKGLREFREKMYSGCELTWKYFNPQKDIPYFIRLIGDRDCWRWLFGEDTKFFNLGMRIYSTSPLDDIWNRLFDDPLKVEDIKKDGKICEKFRNNFCKDYIKNYGFETEFEGYKCFAVGIYYFGSETFGDKIDKYDICLPYEFLGDKWIVGLYSETVDVSVIAKKYGGGGHKGAAGFVADNLPFKKISERG